jgi:hypothetical protein
MCPAVLRFDTRFRFRLLYFLFSDRDNGAAIGAGPWVSDALAQ